LKREKGKSNSLLVRKWGEGGRKGREISIIHSILRPVPVQRRREKKKNLLSNAAPESNGGRAEKERRRKRRGRKPILPKYSVGRRDGARGRREEKRKESHLGKTHREKKKEGEGEAGGCLWLHIS